MVYHHRLAHAAGSHKYLGAVHLAVAHQWIEDVEIGARHHLLEIGGYMPVFPPRVVYYQSPNNLLFNIFVQYHNIIPLFVPTAKIQLFFHIDAFFISYLAF